MVERSLRDTKSSIQPLIRDAVGGVVDTIDLNTSRRPTAPIELTYQTALYMDTDGRQRVRFMLDFPDVTKDTEANDIEIAQYELWGKPDGLALLAVTTDAVPGLAVPGLTMPGLAATPSNLEADPADQPWRLMSTSEASYFRTDGFRPSSTWRFRARAIGVQTVYPGEWSIEVVVQMLSDTTPPPQPSPPTLSIQRGTISVAWDGQSVSGAMPADFKYAVLAHGTDSSPTHEIARFGRGGGFKVVANIPYYDPQFFRLQAYDESGNKSPWSEQAVGYTTPLVDKDIILSEIDAAVTYLHNIDAGVAILPNTILTEHLVVTEEMTAAIANFLHVRADMLEANEIWADEAWFGVADAILVRSDMFEGKAFVGGTFTGALFQTDVEALTGIKFDTTGLVAWNSGGEQTIEVDATDGSVEILGEFQIGRVNEPYVLLAKNIWDVWPGIRFKIEDPSLAYQPSIFAIGDVDESWEKGDLVVMGGQLTANSSPRGQLKIQNRGGDIFLERGFGGAINGVEIGADNSIALRGHLKNYVTSTVMHVVTSQTAVASGTFTVAITPPPYGLKRPIISPDGLNPVDYATLNATSSGFQIRFDGPASNSTSFHGMMIWKDA